MYFGHSLFFWELPLDFVFSKSPPSIDYVIAGMLLCSRGFRIGLFISVFGASARILVSFIQPLIFAFMPPSSYHSIATQSYAGFAFGALLLAIVIVWTVIADRAGEPGVKHFWTFRAFL